MAVKEMAKKNYERGLWTVEMLRRLVEVGRLAVNDYYDITKDIAYVRALVAEGTITETDYQEITGEAYTA